MKKQFQLEDIVKVSEKSGKLFEVVTFSNFIDINGNHEHHYTLRDIHSNVSTAFTPRTDDIMLVKPKGAITAQSFDIIHDAYLDCMKMHEFVNSKEVRGRKRMNYSHLRTAQLIKNLLKGSSD